jgi:hypothetical protein
VLSTSKVFLDPKFVPGELVSVYESSLGVICANKESERIVASKSDITQNFESRFIEFLRYFPKNCRSPAYRTFVCRVTEPQDSLAQAYRVTGGAVC